MSTIQGPKVQLPQANSPFVSVTDETGQIMRGDLSLDAASFLQAVQAITFYSTRSGPTASRPTSSSRRWIGMPYFDTSLGTKGKPIWLAIASSNAWVLADGTAA